MGNNTYEFGLPEAQLIWERSLFGLGRNMTKNPAYLRVGSPQQVRIRILDGSIEVIELYLERGVILGAQDRKRAHDTLADLRQQRTYYAREKAAMDALRRAAAKHEQQAGVAD